MLVQVADLSIGQPADLANERFEVAMHAYVVAHVALFRQLVPTARKEAVEHAVAAPARLWLLLSIEGSQSRFGDVGGGG